MKLDVAGAMKLVELYRVKPVGSPIVEATWFANLCGVIRHGLPAAEWPTLLLALRPDFRRVSTKGTLGEDVPVWKLIEDAIDRRPGLGIASPQPDKEDGYARSLQGGGRRIDRHGLERMKRG